MGGGHGSPSRGKEDEKGHHQAQEPHGVQEGKAQNGVGEEQLLQRGVPAITNDEAPNTAPEPTTPTMAAPAPAPSAAGSMPREMTLVQKP